MLDQERHACARNFMDATVLRYTGVGSVAICMWRQLQGCYCWLGMLLYCWTVVICKKALGLAYAGEASIVMCMCREFHGGHWGMVRRHLIESGVHVQ